MRPNGMEPGDNELEYLADKDPQVNPTTPDLLLTDIAKMLIQWNKGIMNSNVNQAWDELRPEYKDFWLKRANQIASHSQPLIEQKAREEERRKIEGAIHSIWRTADTTQQFTNLILRKDFWDSFKSGEPLEGRKG